MILIGEILVSDDLVEQAFVCHLEKCRGACCWKGDWGAPLEDDEKDTITSILDIIRPYLSEESLHVLNEKGPITYYDEPAFWGTSLLDDGRCVFLEKGESEYARCGFEVAYAHGHTTFRKPISCHLYPVRVSKNDEAGFEALNYDRWDICSAACSYGEALKMPLYRFVRDALIRKYGPDFFEALDAAAQRHSALDPDAG